MLTREHIGWVRDAMRDHRDRDDPLSVNPDLVSRLAAVTDWLARKYFRLEVEGIEKIPGGPALIVGNHNSGISFIEALGFGAHMYVQRGTEDIFHGLAHDKILDVPKIGNLLVQFGAVRASHENAAKIFNMDRKIVVFPGGNLEAFRPYRRRHEIDFGGRTGFIRLALRHEVPIVPVVFIGGHEGFYVLRDGRRLARLLGLNKSLRIDTFPLMLSFPWGLTLGPIFHVPLPTKCVTRILDPIDLSAYHEHDPEDPGVLKEIYSMVVAHMQAALEDLASSRVRPVFG